MKLYTIVCQSLDHTALDEAIRLLCRKFMEHGIFVKGPVPLPTKRKRLTILASPFVVKTTRFQVKVTSSRRLLTLHSPNEVSIRSSLRQIPNLIEECNFSHTIRLKMTPHVA